MAIFDDMDLNSSDEELIADINNTIVNFIQSEEVHLQLEPMNSFRRRIVHKIGTKYKLTSESKGEGTNRSVSLRKTELLESWVENFSQRAESVQKRVKEVDSQGYFEADDEVGSVFEKIKEITNELDNLKETN